MTGFDLSRFVTAQDEGGTYDRALTELRAGEKRSHWMWFVFPQVAGLGLSPTSQHFALGSLAEARAYLADDVLGPRVRSCVDVLIGLQSRSAEQIFGAVDAAKLRSSMTLFALADPDTAVFGDVLERYFDGRRDPMTVQILGVG